MWDYCVQYRESSTDFISRLMELEGIAYHFSHEADKHTGTDRRRDAASAVQRL